jgi:trimeric autotransporter adhesin
MKLRTGCVLVGFLSLVLSLAAQTSGSGPASVSVPPLVNFGGVLTDVNGKPLASTVGMTFSLYKDQQGGAPLWLETQNVKPNSSGHYTVTLGSTSSQGIPANIFASGEARWLGAQVQGQAEQPRVLLVSVPYALKAGDAETLGGKPASAFLVASGNAASGNNAIVDPVTGGGKKDYIPLWLSKTKLGKSNLFQSAAGDLGIGTTTPASTLDVQGTGSIRDTLTLFPQGTDPTLSVQGTGFGVSSTGVVSFVSGQTFPGAGTVTSVGSGAGLTGGPITSSGTLSIATGGVSNAMLVNPGLTVTAGTDLTGGGAVALGSSTTLNLDTTKVPQLNGANAFTGNQTVNGNLSASGVVSGSGYQIGSNLFAFGSYANANAFLGFAGNPSTTGTQNVASGVTALSTNTSGTYNTAIGYAALASNTSGGANVASGWEALFGNTTGNANTAVGVQALSTNTTGGGNTATGNEALWSNVNGFGNTATGSGALFYNTTASDNTATGSGALFYNSTGTFNTASGYGALHSNTTGSYNTASGYGALSNTTADDNTAAGFAALTNTTTGGGNTASGYEALFLNTTGYLNTAVGYDALFDNTTGTYLTCIGYNCKAGIDGLHNATSIGAHAVVGESNALVLGGTGQYAVKVGIGTTTPSNILTIGRGLGHPVSDSWETYSSRRWKTNIQTLPNALAKVEQLRGVSYDLKDSGKHEIGVIAEEVGAVVPEVVSYEKGGKDASGVDYSRLTALLIEAMKQQQKQIAQQQKQIATQQGKIASQDKQLRRLGNKDALLESKLTELQGHVDELRRVKRSGQKAAAAGPEVVAKAQF